MSETKMPEKSLVPRKTPRQNRSKDRVDKILAASLDLLMQEGLGAVTTSKVAQHAGIPVGSVYQYFPNRDAILMAIGQEVLNREDTEIEKALENARHATSLAQIVDGVIDVFGTATFRIAERAELDAALSAFPQWRDHGQASGARIAQAISAHPSMIEAMPDDQVRLLRASTIVVMVNAVVMAANRESDPLSRAQYLKEAKLAVASYLANYVNLVDEPTP